ncbi:hypothetical protein MTP99_016159 [Tenebrio molitor]|jgi:hypothetical protein|nr:hypothetical protein MTP99_016159 [Tenebrio molitor]
MVLSSYPPIESEEIAVPQLANQFSPGGCVRVGSYITPLPRGTAVAYQPGRPERDKLTSIPTNLSQFVPISQGPQPLGMHVTVQPQEPLLGDHTPLLVFGTVGQTLP